MSATQRLRIHVSGIVQGVGFRPFVYGLAEELRLTGFVGNDTAGVFIEVEGPGAKLDEFVLRLHAEQPPAASIDEIAVAPLAARGESGFEIQHSDATDTFTTFVSPDLDVCDDCLGEMREPNDRRSGYPFINCTNCGPRFSIIRQTPYDRASTTMTDFVMCAACRGEYKDPANRRFHAQPNACDDCGPRIWIEQGGARLEGDAVGHVRRVIASGGIVAIKGIGGFHLACDAFDDDAVTRLRIRKGRNAKPFAVMAADLETARLIAVIDSGAAEVMSTRARPIAVVPKQPDAATAAGVAPGNNTIGVMLPYTPLHHLLLQPGDVWVMTSGNRSTEPIVTSNDDARERLATLSDAMLLHDRGIQRPIDDSVVRPIGDEISPIRRSRGFAPFPIRLDFEAPPMLAVGGELKSTICLAQGHFGFMSQHIGDMENLETLTAFSAIASDLQRLFRIEPEVVVCDMHPRYLSRRWAFENAGGRPVLEVQHHEAHVASLLAEHREDGPIIGFSFDGTGYGHDGTVWGGEMLVGSLTGLFRWGQLATFQLPGGDASVARPYRTALSLLRQHGIPWSLELPPVGAAPDDERRAVAHQLETGLNVIPTSSVGRLFDAISSLAGVCQLATYEGQAAIELEAAALFDTVDSAARSYAIDVAVDRDIAVLNTASLIGSVVADVADGVPAAEISARFHRGLAAGITAAARWARDRSGIGTVGLTGGVFQNALLSRLAAELLRAAGFDVLTHRLVPPNDGGLALGQIALAANRL